MKISLGKEEGPLETATPEHDGQGNIIAIPAGHQITRLVMAKDSPTGQIRLRVWHAPLTIE
ncbi:MAG: hypothetical protein V4477_18455 [Pseudomonadota bacterium]